MKVLIIALSFAPINNAQSIRWKYLSENLLKQGANINVVAPLIETSIQLNLSNSIPIKRCNPGAIIYSFFKKKNEIKSNRKKLFFSKLLLYFAENAMLGELFWEWPIRVTKYIQDNIKIKSYDAVIISVEPHIATALPALFLNHDRIILDIGDPPVSNYFSKHRIFQFLHDKIFKYVIKKAKGIVYTCWGAKICLENKYQELKNKPSIVIYQGYERSNVEKNLFTFENENEYQKIKLFYPGSFPKRIRDPKLLIDILSEHQNIDFFLAGPVDAKLLSYFEEKLSSRFHYIGNITHSNIKSMYEKFDAILYFGNKTNCQLSGKFFEFLPTQTVIVQIYQNPKDETIRLSNNIYNFIHMFYDRFCLSQGFKVLLDIITKRKTLRLTNQEILKDYRTLFFQEYDWYNLSNKYLKFIENLT